MTVFVDRGGLELLGSDPRHDAWQVDLDRIELDVLRAERALENGTELRSDPWDVPSHLGPIPEALLERAETIRARQRAVLTEIAERLGSTLRHQSVIDRVDLSSSLSNLPIYLDVSA